MQGTEKQIAWAKDIKAEWVKKNAACEEYWEKRIGAMRARGDDASADKYAATLEKSRPMIEKILQVEDAAAWINARYDLDHPDMKRAAGLKSDWWTELAIGKLLTMPLNSKPC